MCESFYLDAALQKAREVTAFFVFHPLRIVNELPDRGHIDLRFFGIGCVDKNSQEERQNRREGVGKNAPCAVMSGFVSLKQN